MYIGINKKAGHFCVPALWLWVYCVIYRACAIVICRWNMFSGVSVSEAITTAKTMMTNDPNMAIVEIISCCSKAVAIAEA